MKKWLLISLTSLALICVLTILLSPYHKYKSESYKSVQFSILINRPVENVFNFLGKSANASKWSVFVNHITPLNADKIPDGHAGSTRRCFCNKDEQGMQWDELITQVTQNKKRQLDIYNLKNFPITANHLTTAQFYDKLDSNKCMLTFSVFFNAKPSFTDQIKMYVAAYKIKSIFKRNMANIKKLVENNE